MAARRRLLVALLLEDEARAEVDGLRRALSSRDLGRIPPHVTLVPPTNVAEGALEQAHSVLAEAAGRLRPFEARLGPPSTFAPSRQVLYLQVGDDGGAIRRLLDAAATGPLAPPPSRPARPFVPHVTLTRSVPLDQMPAAASLLAGFERGCSFSRVHLLEQAGEEPGRPWRPCGEALLGAKAVVARGGLELELSVARRLDPEAEGWLEAAWAGYSRSAYGGRWRPDEPFAIVARRQGRIVGVATGEVRGAVCECARLVVDVSARGEGIGGHLLRHLERLAAERGCTTTRLLTTLGGPAEGFYARRGYSRAALLPGWREGRDFVVMARPVGG